MERFLNKVICGETIEEMAKLPDKSIDMILCDLPYGTTQNKWDSVIPLIELWQQYCRIIKTNGAIVLTSAQPFTSNLIISNLDMFKYELIWKKDNGTGFLNAKKQPLRNHESIIIFYKQQPVYNPQMREGRPYAIKTGATKSLNYGKQIDVHTECADGLRYPLTVVDFTRDKEKQHPTQKPVALFGYLIKTYTNEGDLVLDNTAGSCTTAVACIRTKRNYICIEKEQSYCDIGEKRIKEELKKVPLF